MRMSDSRKRHPTFRTQQLIEHPLRFFGDIVHFIK
jgi:hypothetical protein